MSETLSWSETLSVLLASGNLSMDHASWCMNEIVSGHATDAQLAGFLVALRAKGEVVDEVLGFQEAILRNALPIEISRRALDIVGTGGDQHKTINVSTTAAIVCASLGVPVIKHGNRAASSASGSSDVLRALGVNLDLDPSEVVSVFESTGIAFIFASAFHPGFKFAAATRSQLGIPTVFNILGPLCNPARPQASAIGVASMDRVPLIVGVLQNANQTSLVLRGDNGLDELSVSGHSHVWEVSRGAVYEHTIHPSDFGIDIASLDDIRGGTPDQNAEFTLHILRGERGAMSDVVALNAAAGLVAFELSENSELVEEPFVHRLSDALARVRRVLEDGTAANKLSEWIRFSHR